MKKFFIILIVVVGLASWYLSQFVFTKRVAGVKVAKKDVTEVLVATGKFSVHRNSPLGFEVSGVLSELLVKEGDLVKRGDLLARLDHQDIDAQVVKAESAVSIAEREFNRVKRPALPEDIERLKASLDAAKANVKQAQLDLKRAEQLGDFGNAVDRDSALTKLEQARSMERQVTAELALNSRLPLAEEVALAEGQLNNSKANLSHIKVLASRRELRAPYDGQIVNRLMDVGVSVPIGSAVVKLAEISAPEILVDTDEANLDKLKIGQIAIVTAMCCPGFSFKAELKRIGPAVDSQRGVVPLMLIPVEVPNWVRLDMTIDICIETAKFSNVMTLPNSAVYEREGVVFVMIEENGLANKKPIKILGKGKEGVALEGLNENDWVAQFVAGIEEGQKLHLNKN